MNRVKTPAYVLLDRDGTLIRFEHYLIDPNRVMLSSGVIEGLQLLQECGFLFGIVSNQSVIGRGIATEEMVKKVNERVTSLLAVEGIDFQFLLYCPHIPEDLCKCRKPATGLGKIAIQKHGLDPSQSYMIGDRSSDVLFGHAIGCKTIQIVGETTDVNSADHFAENFLDAAQWIKSDMGRE